MNLLGWVDAAIVEERLEASDLLLLTSRSEGFPVIGVQALASGLAILASNVGGLSELVESGANGKLCAADDLDCFEQVDIIAGPTTPGPAFALGEKSNDPLAMYLEDVYTLAVNLAVAYAKQGASTAAGC